MPVRVSRRMFVTGSTMISTGLLLNQYDGVLQFVERLGISSLAAGYRFSLAVRAGELFAWGDTTDGQCDLPRNLPRIQQVTAGWTHGLALSTSGDVFAWGGGLNRTPPPFVTIPRTLPPIVDILATQNYSFLLADDRQTLYMLGEEVNGRTFRVMNWPQKIQHMQAYHAGDYVVVIDDAGQVTVLAANASSDSVWQEVEVIFRDPVVRMIWIDVAVIGLTNTGELQYFVGSRELRNGETVMQNASQELIDGAEQTYAIRQLSEITEIVSTPDINGFYTINRQGAIAYRGPTLEGERRALEIPLPRSTKIRNLTCSRSHVLAQTTDGELVSWGFAGDADRGQYDIPRQLLK